MKDLEQLKAKDVLPRIESAIECLLICEWDARKRLHYSMYSIIPLRPDDFPEKQKKIFHKLLLDIWNIDWFRLNYIDKYTLKNEWTYKVYFQKIKNKTAIKYIKILYSIYKELLSTISNN